MRINEIVWIDAVVDKLAQNHGFEEVFGNSPQFRFVQKGNRSGEDVYMATGQTEAGRYLTVLFIHKSSGDALILSARDMADSEKKRHGRK